MADTRTNDRAVARSLWSFVGLIVALICLPFSIAFADSPLQGNHPVSGHGIDELLDDDRSLMGEQMLKQGRIPAGAMRPCISTAAQVRLLDLAPLVPVPTLCVGSTVSADATGWGGYEALGDHERSVGNWSEAEQAYVKAIELLDRTAVKDYNQDLAALLNKLGITRYTQKDFSGAEAAYRKALKIYTSTQGAEDLRVGDTLHLLAMVLFEQPHGRDLAGALFFRAWAIREKVLGPYHLAVAESLQRMALSLYRDDLSKAVPLLLQAMEIRERSNGHAHPSVAETLTVIAGLYEAHHRQDLAIPLYQEALTIQEQVFGPNATETIQVRNSLHMAHREKGSPNEESKGQE